MSSEAVMLDMISLLTLLNSAKEKDEEEGKEVATTNILTHLETGSKVSTFEEGNVVEERDGVLLIGIFMIASTWVPDSGAFCIS